MEIRCKKCGELQIEIKLEGKIDYGFHCKKCKFTNTGFIQQKKKGE